ncbi:MAG: nuclease-related domain-containing protein [Solirubrobacteraceae bacterium]
MPARGMPGGSAKRQYQHRRNARLRRARDRFGLLGALIAWLAGDPRSTTAWRRGAEGEEKVARRLTKLLCGKHVELIHDRLMPGARAANIDHVAVGPGGVTVIDSKNLSGKVRVQRTIRATLRVGGSNRTQLVHGVQRQAEAVRELLHAASIQVEVRAALCLASTDGLPLFSRLEVDGVLIGGSARVAKLAARPGTLSEDQRRLIRETLSVGLREA